MMTNEQAVIKVQDLKDKLWDMNQALADTLLNAKLTDKEIAALVSAVSSLDAVDTALAEFT